jgi:plasmid stabilization system protein ParE
MDVIWTRQSVIQLNKYADYIAQDNVLAAEKWVLSLLGKTDQLSELPKNGRIVPEYNDSNLSEIIEGDYRLIYRIEDEKVYVQSVRHTRQDLRKKK